MNNMAGFDWRREGDYGLRLAKGRLLMDKVSLWNILVRLFIL